MGSVNENIVCKVRALLLARRSGETSAFKSLNY